MGTFFCISYDDGDEEEVPLLELEKLLSAELGGDDDEVEDEELENGGGRGLAARKTRAHSAG
jgi:hypothetical protein